MNKKTNLNRKRLSAWTWLGCLLLGTAAFLTTSCAKDGFTEESFVGTITSGDVLAAPDGSTFKVKSSSDRTTQTVSWKAVDGALDYLVTIYKSTVPFNGDVTGEQIVSDSLVHNPYVGIPRLNATYYRVIVQSAENKAEKNPASETTTTFDWDTYLIEVTVAAKEGEESVDFTKFMEENPIEQIVADFGTLCPIMYYFNENVPYTMSGPVDFEGYEVTLCSDNENTKPTITLGETASFITYNTFTLENLKFLCDDGKKSIITLSATPDEAIKGATGKGDYYNIQSQITLTGCDFDNIQDKLLYDNGLKYCIETFVIDNCQCHFDISKTESAQGYIYMSKGFIKDITIQKSTMWNTGDGNRGYFIKYDNAGRPDRAGYPTESPACSVNFYNNTFYNMGSSQWCNYDGIKGKNYTEINIVSNIWLNCAAGIVRRILGQSKSTAYDNCVINNNTYWKDGASETNWADYDLTGGLVLTSDPGLKNPEGDLTDANFQPSGLEQLQYQTGDPRWLPKEE